MSRRHWIAPSLTIAILLSVSSPTLQAASAVTANAAQDKILLTTLLTRLRQHDAVKAGFTQLKTLRILKKPLRSAGTLLFWRGKGMVWQVNEPVAATYVLNAQGMREVTPTSTSAMSSSTASMPNLLPLFDAIFAGDEAALAQHFDYQISGTPGQWRLKLVPRDAMLLRIFSRLELEGRDYIDNLTLFDTRDDQTRIELQAPQFGSEALSAIEKSLLQ